MKVPLAFHAPVFPSNISYGQVHFSVTPFRVTFLANFVTSSIYASITLWPYSSCSVRKDEARLVKEWSLLDLTHILAEGTSGTQSLTIIGIFPELLRSYAALGIRRWVSVDYNSAWVMVGSRYSNPGKWIRWAMRRAKESKSRYAALAAVE